MNFFSLRPKIYLSSPHVDDVEAKCFSFLLLASIHFVLDQSTCERMSTKIDQAPKHVIWTNWMIEYLQSEICYLNEEGKDIVL